MKKLIENLFIGKRVRKTIEELEKRSRELTESLNSKMSQQQKANIFVEKMKFDFAIDELKNVL